MEIKKFQTSEPTIGPVGVVKPSTAGIRAAESQMRMGQQLLDSAYNMAIDRQKEEGRQFASTYSFSRNEDGTLNVEDYGAIIDEAGLSRVAANTARPLLDRRYLTATNLDIQNAASKFRYNIGPDGEPDYNSPADEKAFVANFQNYIAQTADLSGELAGSVQDIGASVQVQHITDIRNKAVKAALDADKENTLTVIKKATEDILAASVAGATVGEMTFDEETEEVGFTGAMLTQLYEQNMANIDALQARHASRLGDDVVPNLKKQLNKAFYGGRANGMAVRVMNQVGGGSSFDSYSKSQFLLNRMSMVMTNPALYASLDAETKSIFNAAGFTQDFINDNNFIGIRDEVASKITVLEGKVSQEFNTTKQAKKDTRTGMMLMNNQPVSDGEAEDFLKAQGINNAFDVLRAYGEGAFAEGTPLFNLVNGRSMLPPQIKNIFTPDVLADLTAQGQLGNAMNMYFTMTRDFDDFGTEQRLTRGFDENTVALMESLGRYSSSMQPVKIEEWFKKTSEYEMTSTGDRTAIINGRLADSGNDNEKTLDGFLNSTMGSDISQEEILFFRPLAQKYIYFYGVDAAREILQQSKDTVFTRTKYFQSPIVGQQARSRFAPEAIMGREELNEFDGAVDAVLRTLTGGANNFLGRTHHLAPTRQRGTFLVINTESGLLEVDRSTGQPVYVNANAILKARGMRLRQGARAAETEFMRIQNMDLTSDEFAEEMARRRFRQ